MNKLFFINFIIFFTTVFAFSQEKEFVILVSQDYSEYGYNLISDEKLYAR